jgi:hypothetical protein
MPRAGLEPAIPAAKRPQTYALDRAATGIGIFLVIPLTNIYNHFNKTHKVLPYNNKTLETKSTSRFQFLYDTTMFSRMLEGLQPVSL